MVLRVLPLSFVCLLAVSGCHQDEMESDDRIRQELNLRGWVLDNRASERGQRISLPDVDPSPDEMVLRAAAAWGVSTRKLKKVIKSSDGMHLDRLDMLAAAAHSSGVPVRQLVAALASTRKQADQAGIGFPHHLAMVATLAMFDPEPHRVHAYFVSAVEGLSGSSVPGESPGSDVVGRMLLLDRWRRSHERGPSRDGCLDGIILDPDQRRAVSLLLDDAYMVVFCDLVGRFSCAQGLAWQHARHHGVSDDIQLEETWRMTEIARHLMLWGGR